MARVLLFGELKDICSCGELNIDAESSDLLLKYLAEKWPALQSKTITMAVNKKVVHGNVTLSVVDEVALMPPYSGG